MHAVGSGARRFAGPLRGVLCLLALAALSACAGNGPRLSATSEAARYAAMAHGNYTPPGPPSDPWGPYIRAASARFDMPTAWIRAVMHVESGGHEYLNGQLTTSPAGAMGLMQVMPDTYREMAAHYHLGNDPYDPRDNIMAGTAYLRLMYDIYGSPGFLAAYNAGPRRLDDYLADERPLPAETRRYVAMIAPHLAGAEPRRLSPATAYAMNILPSHIPPGLRYPGAWRPSGRQAPLPQPVPFQPAPVQVAMAAPPPPPRPRAPPSRLALVMPPRSLPRPPAPPRIGFRFVPTAYAEPAPAPRVFHLDGGWAVQVGAFVVPSQARHATGLAQSRARALLGHARPQVTAVRVGRAVLWRARLTGLSRQAAVQACQTLERERNACMVLSPEAQS
ncbi:MAG: lytic transglycosylase domain-containing protein [Acetobacteraceae bacterium]